MQIMHELSASPAMREESRRSVGVVVDVVVVIVGVVVGVVPVAKGERFVELLACAHDGAPSPLELP